MLKKIVRFLFVFNIIVVIYFSVGTGKALANYLPINVNCGEKKCCERVDTVKFSIEKLLEEIKNGSMSQQEVACSYHQIAIEYFDVNEPKSIEFNKKAETVRLEINDDLLWRTYTNLAFNYYNIDNFKTAKKYMELALYQEGDKVSTDSISIYQNLTEYNYRLGDWETALEYINKALSVEANEKEKITAYNLKSTVLWESKDPSNISESIIFADSALILSRKHDSDFENEMNALDNIAEAHRLLGNLDKSITYYKKALAVNENALFENAIKYNDISTVLHNQGKYEESNDNIAMALKLYNEHFDATYNHWYSAPYENLADNYTALQQLDTALLYYQKALINLTNKFRNEDVFQNPNSKDESLFVYANTDMIRVLHLKASAVFKHYQQNGDLKHLNLANKTYQTAFNFHDQLQKDISTENSRLFQAKNIVPYIENALKVVYELQENGQDIGGVAFRFMEKNKATVLLQAMNEADALQFANLPGHLLEQEKDLKMALTYHNKQLNDAIEYEETDEIARIKDLLFDERQQYTQLISNLEDRYPNYYRLKYQQNQTQLQDVQNGLDNKTALLEYFVGDSSIYILSIQKNHSKLYQIKKPSNWKQTINDFRQSITDIDRDQPTLFVKTSHQLYQWLLNEPLCDLQEGITRLQIIPDAELNYMPFEILLIEEIDRANIQYKKLPYLLKNKAVGYAYSAALLLENKKIAPSPKMFAYGGYAPEYFGDKANDLSIIRKLLKYFQNLLSGKAYSNAPKNTSDNFNDLPIARQTVQELANILNGKAYLNQKANLSNFLNNTEEDFSILHLSMHGVLNDKNPLNSYMAFSPTSDYKLYAYDLYNMKINSDLTILHACNTGTGELQKGEGVMSLSRAFTYAGCPSLVMSLWQIPEEATSEITQSFIEYLQNGLSKDVALQQAKLSYLQNQPERQASPAYWAGLVATGNLEAIQLTQ